MLWNKTILYGILFLFVAACGNRKEVAKIADPEKKFEAAKAYYNKKDYQRAIPMLEELLTTWRGTDKAEMVYYYYAYCFHNANEFEVAAYHFKNFTESFYNSKYTEEMAYRYVYCRYKVCLPYYLDQNSTLKTIQDLQLFINLYPKSTYIPLCNKHIDELRVNLQKKAFENAMLFYKIGDYRAASVSFKNIIIDFPDIEQKEEIEFMIIKSNFLFAKNSIDEKKKERFQDVINAFNEFIESNGRGTTFYQQALDYKNKAEEELKKL